MQVKIEPRPNRKTQKPEPGQFWTYDLDVTDSSTVWLRLDDTAEGYRHFNVKLHYVVTDRHLCEAYILDPVGPIALRHRD